MNNLFLKNFMNAVFGQGTSKAAKARHENANRVFPEGTRFQTTATSRQIERARLRDKQYRTVALSGTTTYNNSFQPEPRKARRQMARALAAAAWKTRNAVTA